MERLKKALVLFVTFFKIGLFTFGGGYAMIALLEREFVEKRKWTEHDEFLNIIAVAESSPGPIAINCATYLGYKRSGFWGSLAATIGVVLPSLIIIYVISVFYEQFMALTLVQYAFRGIQACVAFLIFSAGIKMFKGLKHNVFNVVMFILSATAFLSFTFFAIKFSTIYYILIGGAIGLFVYLISFILEKKKIKGDN